MAKTFLIILFVAFSSFAARAERLSAVIYFLEIQRQTLPSQKTFRQPRNIKVLLLDDHRVQEWSARRADQPDQRSLSYETVLGALTDVQWVKVKWNFQDNNILVRKTFFPSHSETMTIDFRAGRCAVALSYDLNPGFDRFEMWDLDSKKRTQHDYIGATQARCAIDEEMTS